MSINIWYIPLHVLECQKRFDLKHLVLFTVPDTFLSFCACQGSATVTLTGVSTITPGWNFAALGPSASSQLPEKPDAASIQTAVEVPPTAKSTTFMFLTPPPASVPGEPTAQETAQDASVGGDESQLAMEFFHSRGNPAQRAGPSTSGAEH